jgi:ABC-type transport system substrate-binding protein
LTPGDRRRSPRLEIALVLLLLVAGAGCRDESVPNPADRNPSLRSSGANGMASGGAVDVPVLRIPLPVDPGSLNPLVARLSRQTQFWPLLYPALLRTTARGAAVPDVEGDLARWWQWDATAHVLTCGLRGRLWEDTTRVSVQDVVRTYEAFRALGWFDRRAPGDSLPDAGLVAVQAVDDSIVRFTYRPEVSFWRALGAASWPVLPARKLGDLSVPMLRANQLGREPMSAGPFRVSDWRSGLNLWLAPQPFSGAARRPQVERVEFDVCPGIDARILRVQMGRADIALDVPVDRLASLVETRAPVYLHHAGIQSVEMLLWNLRSPAGRSEIRDAVSLAVDRERIVETLLTWRDEVCGGPAGGLLEPLGPPADSIEIPRIVSVETILTDSAAVDTSGVVQAKRDLPPDSTGAAPDTIPAPALVFYAPLPRFDRAAADSVLDAAGWTERDAEGFRVRDGLRLRVELLYDRTNLFREQLATLLESDLARVGVELVPVPIDGTAVWSRLHAGVFSAVLAGFRPPDVPDPSSLWASWGYWNGTGFASARVDSLCAELLREENVARRLRLARQVESLVRRSGPVTFLVYREWAALLHNRVEGFDGRSGDPLRGLERVRLVEAGGARP